MPTEPTEQVDLHGIEKQPFPDFSETHQYLERLTVTTGKEAIRIICDEYGLDPKTVSVLPIWMRWVTDGNDPEIEAHLVPDIPCWLECHERHPDAVPFWKEEV